MTNEAVTTSSAPAAIGPYSQAIRSGGLLFTSGQLGMDPASGALVEGGTVAQAERALRNLGAVLDAAGFTYADVVKVTIYLADMADFAAVNEVYTQVFSQPPWPARSTIGVRSIPKDARIELEAVAVRS